MSLPNDIVPDRDEARRRQAGDPLLGSAAAAADTAGLACPDAELLGLYAERALSRTESAAIAAHVQGCPRCEAVVAAITRALPDAAVAGEGAADGAGVAGWLSGWRWLVPALSLAGAAVVAFWLGRSPAQVSELEMARTETALPRPAEPSAAPAEAMNRLAPPQPTPAPTAAAPGVPAGAAPGILADGTGAPVDAAARRADTAALAKKVAESADARERSAEHDAGPVVTGNAVADAAKPAAAEATGRAAAATASTAMPAAAAPARMASAEAPPPPAPPAAPAIAPPPAAGSPAPATREERARAAAPRATAEGGAAQGGAARGAGAGAADLRAPFPRWRVRNGRVEFARDGRAWRRVTLPSAERVTSVTERPDGSVLVITASGAQFVSSNLGATWQRQ